MCSAQAVSKTSRLLSLPCELRLLIWDYAVSVQYITGKWTFEPYALLQACRQTFVEVLPCIRGVLAERLTEFEARFARAAEKRVEDNDTSASARRKRGNRKCIVAFQRKRMHQIRKLLNDIEPLIKLAEEIESRP